MRERPPSVDELLWSVLAGAAGTVVGATMVYAVLLALPPFALVEHWRLLVAVAAVAAAAEAVALLPSALAVRYAHRHWRWPMLATVAAGVTVTLLVGLPPLFVGWGSPDRTRLAEIASATIVFGIASLLKAAVIARASGPQSEARPIAATRPSLRQATTAFIAAMALLGAATLLKPEWTAFWRPAPQIERHLLAQTPLGSPATDVIAALAERGVEARLTRHRIQPNSEYPLTRTGGASSFHVVVSSYRVVFWVSIEAFYVFDERDRLADVRVRTTVDAP